MGDKCADEELNEDLAIFSCELFSYVSARRICYREFSNLHLPIEGSKFVEEIGKAAMFTWHNFQESYRQKLSDDFPKYLDTVENFERYFMHVAREIEHELDSSYFTEQLLRVTAFLLELCHYCREKGHTAFFNESALFWYNMFLSIFYPRFKSAYGWKTIYKGCLDKSDKYDAEKVEKFVGHCYVQLNYRYFTPNDDAGIRKLTKTCYCRKLLSRFHVIDRKTWKPVLPCNFSTRPRAAQLTRIKALMAKSESQTEDESPIEHDLIQFAIDRHIYMLLRKRRTAQGIINVFRSDHLKMKRKLKKRLQDIECEGNQSNQAKADKCSSESGSVGEGFAVRTQNRVSDVVTEYLQVVNLLKNDPEKDIKAEISEVGKKFENFGRKTLKLCKLKTGQTSG